VTPASRTAIQGLQPDILLIVSLSAGTCNAAFAVNNTKTPQQTLNIEIMLLTVRFNAKVICHLLASCVSAVMIS
jgi:hypothetical protein